MRILAVALLAFAATQPTSICTKLSKSPQPDGSMNFNEFQEERKIWQELDSHPKLLDVAMVTTLYAWPLIFLMIRVIRGNPKTRRPIGVLESLFGGVCVLIVVAFSKYPCWTIFRTSEPQMMLGYYLALIGGLAYLSAWPIEFLLTRKKKQAT